MNSARLKLQWSNITWAKVETLKIQRRLLAAQKMATVEEELEIPQPLSEVPAILQLPMIIKAPVVT